MQVPSPSGLSRENSLTTSQLLGAVHGLLIDFIRAADEAAPLKASGNASVAANGETRSALVESLKPEALLKRFAFELPDDAQGKDGMVDLVSKVLKYSVNTWDQGFLDKLYATSTPVGSSAAPVRTPVRELTDSRLVSCRTCCSPCSTQM